MQTEMEKFTIIMQYELCRVYGKSCYIIHNEERFAFSLFCTRPLGPGYYNVPNSTFQINCQKITVITKESYSTA